MLSTNTLSAEIFNEPLISCVMLTSPGRDKFREEAIQCYDLQTYENRELIIVDERCNTVGEKRNIACNRANGTIIAHWDDDDWSAPIRLEDQLGRMQEFNCQITGYHSMLFYHTIQDEWYQYTGHAGYALGTSLFYQRSHWERHLFAQISVGEDNMFIRTSKVISVDAEDKMFARIHHGNTSNYGKVNQSNNWQRVP